jgi:hypothetical protein
MCSRAERNVTRLRPHEQTTTVHITGEDSYLTMENLFLSLQLSADDEEVEDEGDLQVLAVLAVQVAANQSRVDRRHRSRHYLTRPQLLPQPRRHTAWQRLYAVGDNGGFITTMGFDMPTFESILSSGFRQLWDERVIQRADVNSMGAPRPGSRSLDAAGGLGLVLHYLSSTMNETSLQEIFALIPATVSCYINFGLDILLEVFRTMPDAAIVWPKGGDFARLNSLIVTRHPLLTGAFASIDGLNIPVQTSSDEDIEQATYNGWLHAHFVSSVLAFSPEGKSPILHLNLTLISANSTQDLS